MISNSASNSILKTSSTSSLSNPEPHSIVSHNHTRAQTPSSLEGSIEGTSSVQSSGKKCYICERSFMIRKKNLCKACNNYVCNEHFGKLMLQEKICDFCYRRNEKNDIKAEIDKEIKILTEEHERSKEKCNKIDREYCQKISEINKIEQSIAKIVDYHDGKTQLLLARLANEKERSEINKKNLENCKKTIEETEITQIEMVNKYQIVEDEFKRLTLELQKVKEKNSEIFQFIETEKKSNLNKVFYSDLKNKICKKCEAKIDNLSVKPN